MMDERLDFDALIGNVRTDREDRVVRAVMAAVTARPAPRADLRSAIRLLAAPALAVAAVIVVTVRIAPARGMTSSDRSVTVGTALGISAAADRAIRGSEPVSAQQLLAALEGKP
jgi:hypothetical protein